MFASNVFDHGSSSWVANNSAYRYSPQTDEWHPSVSFIPPINTGFSNNLVTIADETYITQTFTPSISNQAYEVTFSSSAVFETYYFIQLTDLHFGYNNARDKIQELIPALNYFDCKPAFFVHTGVL